MDNSAHTSCIIPAATSMSGESSWAMHIANFLAASHNSEEMDQEVLSDSSFSSGFSSSFSSLGGDASFVTSELMSDDDDDDSLQDTACSSATGHKVIGMKNVDANSMVDMDVKEITPQEKYFADVSSRQHAIDAVQEVVNGDEKIEKGLYECSELRKKGLCLVPISMLIDYLG